MQKIPGINKISINLSQQKANEEITSPIYGLERFLTIEDVEMMEIDQKRNRPINNSTFIKQMDNQPQ